MSNIDIVCQYSSANTFEHIHKNNYDESATHELPRASRNTTLIQIKM